MSDPDESIAAAPSALLIAAGAERSAAAALRATSPAALDAAAAGDPASVDALRGALQAAVAMVASCADGIDDLAIALSRAADAYALSDAVALPSDGPR